MPASAGATLARGAGINWKIATAGNRANAFWIDPKTGKPVSIGSFSNTGVQSFSTPDGWEDALLILEATRNMM